MMHEIETSRLYLRRPSIKDELKLQELWRDETVQQFVGGIVQDDIIQERIMTIQSHWDQNEFGLCTVYEKSTSQIAGLCGLQRREDGLELSYKFFPSFWGQGLGKEATSACLDYGFAMIEDNSIAAITQDANHRSCRLLESIGIKYIKSFRRFDFLQRLYEISRQDYFVKLFLKSQ